MNPFDPNRGRPLPTPLLETSRGRSLSVGTSRGGPAQQSSRGDGASRSKSLPPLGKVEQDLLSAQSGQGLSRQNSRASLLAGIQVPTGVAAAVAGAAASVSQGSISQDSVHLLVPITTGTRTHPFNLQWSNPRSLTRHFLDHGQEFPGIASEADYLAEAKSFWSKPIQGPQANGQVDIVEKRGSRGPLNKRGEVNFYKLYRFEKSTGIISVLQPDPVSPSTLLVSLFKPGHKKPLHIRLPDAESYFDRQ